MLVLPINFIIDGITIFYKQYEQSAKFFLKQIRAEGIYIVTKKLNEELKSMSHRLRQAKTLTVLRVKWIPKTELMGCVVS